MAQFTAAQVEEHASKIIAQFADGFAWSDILAVVPQVMEIVQAVGAMSSEEKQASFEAVMDYIIDSVDLPWLPDSLVDPVLKQGVRLLAPMLIKAAKGELKID